METHKMLLPIGVLLFLLCVGKWALSAQQPLNAITKKTTGDYVTQIREGVNTELAKQQTMNTELYTNKADKSSFATVEAFTAAWGWSPATGTTQLPAWFPSTAPTNGRQIMQAVGGCSLTAYETQALCTANSGTWTTPTYQHTSIISGLINDTGTADDDLWSAARIIVELATKQNTLVAGTDYLTPATAAATYQLDLSIPDQAEAEAGTATIERAWTAQRIAQAIAALAPSGTPGEGYYEIDGGSSASLTFTGDIDGGASI